MNNITDKKAINRESKWTELCFQQLCRLEDRAVIAGSEREKELKMQAKQAYMKMISCNNQQIDM